MIGEHDNLFRDFEAVRQIEIVPTMLDVICRTTGMGFSAVARVTHDRWLACRVLDSISFGLPEGGELEIASTICNEIRDHGRAVVIDDVDLDPAYCSHHTPLRYGFKSYISFPIILRNGEFFGTLCAIDPRPAKLSDPKVLGLFETFTELLGLHLEGLELIRKSESAIIDYSKRLGHLREENLQYGHLSNHNMQEPLRKIGLYSNLLVQKAGTSGPATITRYAAKINELAEGAIRMVRDIADFSGLGEEGAPPAFVDLGTVVGTVVDGLGAYFTEKGITVHVGGLPTVHAVPEQMARLFSHLLEGILPFSAGDTGNVIRIYAGSGAQALKEGPRPGKIFAEIKIDSSGTELESFSLENIFNILVHMDGGGSPGYSAGLADCRKIVHNHGGELSVASSPGKGTSFSITLPVAD